MADPTIPVVIEWESSTNGNGFTLRLFGPHPSGEATFDLIRTDQNAEFVCSNITPDAARQLRDWLNDYLAAADTEEAKSDGD